MSNEAGAENATDAVASALMDLAAEVAGLDDCRPVRDRALKGGSEFHIPPQLSELDSCQAAVNALAADERLAILVDEGTPDRPIVRVGPYGVRLRVSTLPLGMIASAIVQCCLREPYAGWPAPSVLGGRDRGEPRRAAADRGAEDRGSHLRCRRARHNVAGQRP